MWDGTQNQDRIRDIENVSGGLWDEIVLVGPGFVTIRRQDVGYFAFEGGMRFKTWSKPVPFQTGSGIG